MLHQIQGLNDVAFEIVKSHYFKESRKPHKLKVRWWRVTRLHGVNRILWPMNLTQNIELTKEQWKTLKLFTPTGSVE